MDPIWIPYAFRAPIRPERAHPHVTVAPRRICHTLVPTIPEEGAPRMLEKVETTQDREVDANSLHPVHAPGPRPARASTSPAPSASSTASSAGSRSTGASCPRPKSGRAAARTSALPLDICFKSRRILLRPRRRPARPRARGRPHPLPQTASPPADQLHLIDGNSRALMMRQQECLGVAAPALHARRGRRHPRPRRPQGRRPQADGERISSTVFPILSPPRHRPGPPLPLHRQRRLRHGPPAPPPGRRHRARSPAASPRPGPPLRAPCPRAPRAESVSCRSRRCLRSSSASSTLATPCSATAPSASSATATSRSRRKRKTSCARVRNRAEAPPSRRGDPASP